MVLEDAMILFGFKPGSIQDRSSVLKVYRKLSFKFHPDHGGDADDFKKLTDAFKLLAKVFKDIGVAGSDDIVTICGRQLSDLGKGYPITESACTCDECDGMGYRKYSGLKEGTGEYRSCEECGGDGVMSHPCKKCGGTGRYIHPRSGKDIGECYRCKGSGKFYPFSKKRFDEKHYFHVFMFNEDPYIPGTRNRGIRCPACSGAKEVEIKTDGKPFFRVCEKCDGIGEVKMWNPVIPRGYIT